MVSQSRAEKWHGDSAILDRILQVTEAFPPPRVSGSPLFKHRDIVCPIQGQVIQEGIQLLQRKLTADLDSAKCLNRENYVLCVSFFFKEKRTRSSPSLTWHLLLQRIDIKMEDPRPWKIMSVAISGRIRGSLTLLRFPSSWDPGYVTIHDQNHICLANGRVRGNGHAEVRFMAAADAQIRSNHLEDAYGELVTEFF